MKRIVASFMLNLEFKNQTTAKIVDFLVEIGLEVRAAVIEEETFLPGILIDHGPLLVDEEKLKYPGDLLHEAGHLVVIPADQRKRVQKDAGKKAAEEMMAIAWSYAASSILAWNRPSYFMPMVIAAVLNLSSRFSRKAAPSVNRPCDGLA